MSGAAEPDDGERGRLHDELDAVREDLGELRAHVAFLERLFASRRPAITAKFGALLSPPANEYAWLPDDG
jgi:hypothetical protein